MARNLPALNVEYNIDIDFDMDLPDLAVTVDDAPETQVDDGIENSVLMDSLGVDIGQHINVPNSDDRDEEFVFEDSESNRELKSDPLESLGEEAVANTTASDSIQQNLATLIVPQGSAALSVSSSDACQEPVLLVHTDISAPADPEPSADSVSAIPITSASATSSSSSSSSSSSGVGEVKLSHKAHVTIPMLAIGGLESEEHALELLFNHLSANVTQLRANDIVAWLEFDELTKTVCAHMSEISSKNKLCLHLEAQGFDEARGWVRSDKFDVDLLLQSFANIYLTAKAAASEKAELEDDSQISKIKNIQALSFCPNVLFANFPPVFDSQPCSRSVQSAVLLADISGFSKFAGERCLEGAKGLDVLHKVTSDFLGHFVHTVYDYEGDVIAFAGDALICIFPATDEEVSTPSRQQIESTTSSPSSTFGASSSGHGPGGGGGATAPSGPKRRTLEMACAQALRCAYDLREHKIHSLSAHFALSCGPIQFALLGGVNDEWTYLMNGACISELTSCIDNAPPQHVVCTMTCMNNASDAQPGCFSYSPVETDKALLTSVTARSPSTDIVTLASLSVNKRFNLSLAAKTPRNGSLSARGGDRTAMLNQMVEKACVFIPRPVLNAMDAGSLSSIAELRKVTTMFLNLDSYSLKDNVDPLSLQPFFNLLQEMLKKSGGFLRQFLIDDKGCVAIAMWGVPSYTHTNDSTRGLYCAWNMNTRVAELNHRCSIGLTTGHAYCGIIGSSFRRDYACIGDKVNIAARLMAKAKGRVLVDPDIYQALDSEEKRDLVATSRLQLKGMPGPITPYTFGESVDLSELRLEENDAGSVLRKDVVTKILAVLDKAVVSTPFLAKMPTKDKKMTDDLKSAIIVGVSGKEAEDDNSGLDASDMNKSFRNRMSGVFKKSASNLNKAASDDDSVSITINAAGMIAPARNSQKLTLQASPSVSRPTTPKFSAAAHAVLAFGTAALAHSHVTPSSAAASSSSSGGSGASSAHVTANSHDKRNKSNLTVNSLTRKERHNSIIILTGMAGTGKSSTAQFFKQSAIRRRLKCATVQCRVDDEQNPYSVVRKFFWEIAGKIKFGSDSQKRSFIVDLVSQVNDGEEEATDEEFSSFLQDILIQEAESVKRRMSTLGTSGKMRSLKPEPGTPAPSSIKDSAAAVALSPNASKSESLITPEDINLLFVKMMQTMLSNHPATTALVIEHAQYCDELTWIILENMQLVNMKLIMLLTTTNKQEPIHKTITAASAPPTPQGALNSNRRASSFGSAVEELKVAANTGVSMKRSMSEAKSGMSFTNCDAYANIIQDPATTLIEMVELNETEVGDVLRHMLQTKDVPASLLTKVRAMTGGNAFWIKAIAKFIKENGIEDFMKTTEGNALQALKNLIICRLEKVSTEQQLVIKHASVIGEEFSYRTLGAVLPSNLFTKLKHSLAVLVEHGFLYLVEEKPLAIYSFQNPLTRDTIYDLLPPSDASAIHLAAAEYIQRQYSANLRQFYHSLSYHYSLCDDEHVNAFKYTVKAADQSISKGAYRNGLELLMSAEAMAEDNEEYEMILRVVKRAIADMVKSNEKKNRKIDKKKSALGGAATWRSPEISRLESESASDQAMLSSYKNLQEDLEYECENGTNTAKTIVATKANSQIPVLKTDLAHGLSSDPSSGSPNAEMLTASSSSVVAPAARSKKMLTFADHAAQDKDKDKDKGSDPGSPSPGRQHESKDFSESGSSEGGGDSPGNKGRPAPLKWQLSYTEQNRKVGVSSKVPDMGDMGDDDLGDSSKKSILFPSFPEIPKFRPMKSASGFCSGLYFIVWRGPVSCVNRLSRFLFGTPPPRTGNPRTATKSINSRRPTAAAVVPVGHDRRRHSRLGLLLAPSNEPKPPGNVSLFSWSSDHQSGYLGLFSLGRRVEDPKAGDANGNSSNNTLESAGGGGGGGGEVNPRPRRWMPILWSRTKARGTKMYHAADDGEEEGEDENGQGGGGGDGGDGGELAAAGGGGNGPDHPRGSSSNGRGGWLSWSNFFGHKSSAVVPGDFDELEIE